VLFDGWQNRVKSVSHPTEPAFCSRSSKQPLYAGFGPATANSFRKMIGLKEVAWEEMKQEKL